MPGLKRNTFSSLAGAPKGANKIIAKNGLSLDLEPFSVQLTRFDNVDYFDLTIAKKGRRTFPPLTGGCSEGLDAFKIFSKQSLLSVQF